MTSAHLSWALGEAHRAELRRQAERHRRRRPANRAVVLTSTAIGRILGRLNHSTPQKGHAPRLTDTVAIAGSGE